MVTRGVPSVFSLVAAPKFEVGSDASTCASSIAVSAVSATAELTCTANAHIKTTLATATPSTGVHHRFVFSSISPHQAPGRSWLTGALEHEAQWVARASTAPNCVVRMVPADTNAEWVPLLAPDMQKPPERGFCDGGRYWARASD